jgi:hypothetical protein
MIELVFISILFVQINILCDIAYNYIFIILKDLDFLFVVWLGNLHKSVFEHIATNLNRSEPRQIQKPALPTWPGAVLPSRDVNATNA